MNCFGEAPKAAAATAKATVPGATNGHVKAKP